VEIAMHAPTISILRETDPLPDVSRFGEIPSSAGLFLSPSSAGPIEIAGSGRIAFVRVTSGLEETPSLARWDFGSSLLSALFGTPCDEFYTLGEWPRTDAISEQPSSYDYSLYLGMGARLAGHCGGSWFGGSGSIYRMASPTCATYSGIQNRSRLGVKSREAVDSAADLLTRIRAHLSFNTTEIARVLGVERPTIYGWMKATHFPQLEHRARLLNLAKLATFWTEHSRQPLGDLKNAFVQEGSTVLELLSMAGSDYVKAERVLLDLTKRLNRKPAEEAASGTTKRQAPVDSRTRDQSIRGISSTFRKGR
jgi:hypothetical protein